MSYKIKTIPNFERELKGFAKKYRSIKNDLLSLSIQLSNNPRLGDEVIQDCYKIRMAISSKGKGKSKGARIITYIIVDEETVMLLSIYDKSEHSAIDTSKIKLLLNDIYK